VTRTLLHAWLFALASCGGSVEAEREAGPSPRPSPRRSLILIVADTLRADGATPNIDRLAAAGASFERTFTHAPITLPAHVALFSSRPCHETGVITNGQAVPADLPLLAEHLRRIGWRTWAVTSLGSMRTGDPTVGLGRGFERYERAGDAFIDPGNVVNDQLAKLLDGIDGSEPFFLFAHFSDPHEPYNDHEGSETAEILVDGESRATVSTSNMTTWTRRLQLAPGGHVLEIEGQSELRLRTLTLRCGGQPLEPRFVEGRLKVPGGRIEVHFEVPEGATAPVELRLWISDHPRRKETRRRYGSEVRYVDAEIGVLLDELRARDLFDESLIVLTSDHGESLGERRFIGHVRSLHDELLHVPLVVKPPAGSPHVAALRARADDLVALIDVVPTVLELLELPALPGQRGHSLLGDERRSFVISETFLPRSLEEDVMAIDLLSIRDRTHKLVYRVDEQRFELFDLEADPGELTDVFAQLDASRASWPDMLRTIFKASQTRLTKATLDEATLETLEALGYLGD